MGWKRRRGGHAAAASTGVVRWWDAEEGWGVVDSPDTPGGCAVIFPSIRMDGYKTLADGQRVAFTFQPGPQDGYPWRAVTVDPL